MSELQDALEYVLNPAEVAELSAAARKAIATVWKAATRAADPDYEAAADQMKYQGWTCNYHEPEPCSDCDALHAKSATQIVNAALGITEDTDA